MALVAKYDIFISYSNADQAWVEGYLLDALEQAGVCYHSEAAFALGTVKLLEFEQAIQQSRRTLLVLSPAYLTNGFNQFIDLLAQGYGLDTQTWPVIPLVLQSMPLPPRLNGLVKLNATNQQEQQEAINRLCRELKHSEPKSASKPACPYPGMVPFSEQMSDRFFGRDPEVQELIERLRLYPFIAVIGSSGSGKSSLVLAGLIPQLRNTRLIGTGNWLIRVMVPGETPLIALETALGSDSVNLVKSVAKVLATQPDAQQLLLVVDQWEEVFTVAGEQALPFQRALQRLVNVPNCYIVLTVRADFYPELMSSPLWSQIQSHRLEIVPLDDAELREAIVKPAQDVGVFIEPTLVERLVRDAAGEPGVLPLIQETLVLLWERLERRFLPLRAYEALVVAHQNYRVFGNNQLTALQVAIARRADAAIAALSEAQKVIARRIFLRLIQFGEGRADTRRQQSVDALLAVGEDSHLFSQTLRHLADVRLLTLSSEEQTNKKVDIAHEALISSWPTLQQWISERWEAEQTRRRLEAKTQEWVRLHRGNSGLLDEVELAEAQRWLSSADAAVLGYDEGLVALVKASEQAIQEAIERAEQARLRELKQERKARKAAQRTIRVGLISLLLIIGFAFIATFEAIKAEKQLIIATSKYSSVLSDSHQEFDALIASLNAGTKLQRTIWAKNDSQIQNQILPTLQEAVYGVREHNRLEGHKDIVYSVSFSPDSKILASGSADNTVKLWNLDGSLQKTLTEHQGSVYMVSFSPDSKTLASASADKTIKLWNPDGSLRKNLTEHSDAVRSISFSPDSKILASASADHTIKLWNQNGGLLKTLPGHTDVVNDVSFSPNGQILASASADHTIKLWKQDGTFLKTLVTYNRPVLSISFSPDGQIVAATSEDGTIKFWSLDGKLIKSLFENNIVNRVIFSPDGKTIASVGGDTIVKLWNPDGMKLQVFPGHTDGVYGVAFSADGQKIASASVDHTIKLWNRDSILMHTLQGHNGEATNVVFSPDNQMIASASADKTIKLWRREGTLIRTLVGHTDYVHSVSFSSNSQMIASASWDGTIKLWNSNGALLKILTGHVGRVYGVVFSPNDQIIASCGEDRIIRLWRIDGTPLKTLVGHTDAIHSVKFSPDGKILASASHDQTVKLWNIDDGTLSQTLRGHSNWVHQISFSPDGKLIASASHDRTVKLWELPNGRLRKTIIGHNGKVLGVSFSPDGKMIASSSEDQTVKLWRLDGNLVATLRGHGGLIHGVNFSPDNKTVASASKDNTLILWNLKNLDNLNALLVEGCDWVRDYLKNNPNVEESDQRLCINK
jgi:WD40 repeat protein